MVILGIDPGLAHTGWGIIEERRGEVRCRAYGCIETSAGSPLAVRLSHIAHDLKDVVERYRPDTAAVESIYFGANVRSAIPTAHARGAALVALSECALEIGEYTPMQIKQAVVGTGAADKRQVAYMVRTLTQLDHDPRPCRRRVLSTERNRILMISQLHGTLVEATMSSAVVDVSGVGFELGISGSTAATLPTPGGEVRLYTRMQVREDAMTLFGFSSKDERTMFDRLTYTVGQLYSLVMAEDDKGMAKVPGVGKKTAQRLILELKSTFAKDKGFVPVDVIPGQVAMPVPAAAPSAIDDARAALLSMGFSPQETYVALSGYDGQNMRVEDLLGAALKRLGMDA